jgi:hypothetical protein
MIPPISELPRHPFQYLGVCIDVLRLHEEHQSALTAERRRRAVDDVAKRDEYRKAHGLEPAKGFFGATSRREEKAETEEHVQPIPVVESVPPPTPEHEFTPEGKRKKFLGIF